MWSGDAYNEWLAESKLVHYDWADLTASPKLAWIDVETTGLDPETNVLLEVGIVVTDKWGRPSGAPLSLYIRDDSPKRANALRDMEPFVKDMHHKSGLTKMVDPYSYMPRQDTATPYEAEDEIVEYLRTFGGEKKIYMAGSTVGFDRFAFLQRYMPQVHEYCHYRSVDNSTIKVMCEEHNPSLLRGLPTPAKRHRSLPDLVDSILEYQFYLDNFFFIPGEVLADE